MTLVRSPKDYAQLQERIGYRFDDIGLLEQSMTHGSSVGDCSEEADNERLEFLGDAVLELAVTDWLYRDGASASEGRLTQMRARMVNRRSLARVARTVGLGSFIKLGKGEATSGGARKGSINANCLEALIGAVYLDGGFSPALSLIRRLFHAAFHEAKQSKDVRDSKSILQEFALANLDTLPVYELLSTEGQDHERTFHVRVVVGETYRMSGSGTSKKTAEMDAARKLLDIVSRDSGDER